MILLDIQMPRWMGPLSRIAIDGLRGQASAGISMCVNMANEMTAAPHAPDGPSSALIRLPVLDCTPLLAGAALDESAAARLAGVLRVLGDPARLRILSLLQAQLSHEACVCHLTDFLGIGQPTVSHHLRVLFDAGLVQRERRGNWVYYRVVPEVLDGVRAALGAGASDDRSLTTASTACGEDCQCR